MNLKSWVYAILRWSNDINAVKKRSLIDGRTTTKLGYAISQRKRKLVEEIFGWMKTVGGFRRTRYRGLDRTGLAGYLVATAYNLVRLSRLALRRAEIPAAGGTGSRYDQNLI